MSAAALPEKERHRPWMKFYPSDWRADPRLRSCSYAARGLWIDLVALMHEADPYGHMVVNGAPPDIPTLARVLGTSAQTAMKLISELDEAGVFSRTPEGSSTPAGWFAVGKRP
jgi:hypothetical protein